MRKQKGISLIELVIVGAIILIIPAIAIPNLLRARIAANEVSAIRSIATLNTAQSIFQSSYPDVGFASTTAQLGPNASTGCTTPSSTNACLVDWSLAQASTAGTAKSGYYFEVTPSTLNGIVSGYTVDGIPASVNQTGTHGFCSNEDAVIRSTAVGSAMSGSNAACEANAALQ